MAHSSHHNHEHLTNSGDDLPPHGLVQPEPKTPLWLPLVGFALAACVVLWWLAQPNSNESSSPPTSLSTNAIRSAAIASNSAQAAASMVRPVASAAAPTRPMKLPMAR